MAIKTFARRLLQGFQAQRNAEQEEAVPFVAFELENSRIHRIFTQWEMQTEIAKIVALGENFQAAIVPAKTTIKVIVLYNSFN